MRELLARGATRVVAVDSLVRGHQGAIDALNGVAQGRLRFAKLDLRERAPLAALLAEERPDAVLHFAAYTLVGESVAQPAMYWSCGVGGTSSLLEAMRAAGTERMVFSSTAATYGAPEQMPISETTPQRPVNPYGASKLACESMIREEVEAARKDGRAFGATMLRYFNVAGSASDGLLGEDHDPETHLVPSALQAAIAEDERERAQGCEDDRSDPAAPSVSLRQRAWPLIDMMQRCQAANEPIVWGV